MAAEKFIKSLFFGIFIAAFILYFLFCRTFLVETGSMRPVIQPGSLVIVQKSRLPEPGDICAYESGSSVIIHRVEDITEEGYITKGDANSVPDPFPVQREQIKGTVVLILNFTSLFLRNTF